MASWLRDVFARAPKWMCSPARIPACHTARRHPRSDGTLGWVANNGCHRHAQLHADLAGLCTRIGRSPSPHPSLSGPVQGAYLALLPVRYDAALWHAELSGAVAGRDSAAWLSLAANQQGPAFLRSSVRWWHRTDLSRLLIGFFMKAMFNMGSAPVLSEVDFSRFVTSGRI